MFVCVLFHILFNGHIMQILFHDSIFLLLLYLTLIIIRKRRLRKKPEYSDLQKKFIENRDFEGLEMYVTNLLTGIN